MDDLVIAAMAKWPNVPHCYGWLGLDERGDWYMRDDRVQALGRFPASKGSRLQHDKLIAFINRNYGRDARGAYFFQNGPQRVYVELAITPYVWRLRAGQVFSHTEILTTVKDCYCDERGYVYLETDLGFGLVHTQDVGVAADLIEAGTWTVQSIKITGEKKSEGLEAASDLENLFGFVKSPAQII